MSAAPSPSSFKVLCVDDEPVIRALLTALLEDDGVQVRCAADGARAIAEARSWRPDLVLLDVVLPGLDGLTVCRMIKSDPALAAVPVHMLTARSRAPDRAAADRAGADGYIEKPFRGQTLQDLVASLRARA